MSSRALCIACTHVLLTRALCALVSHVPRILRGLLFDISHAQLTFVPLVPQMSQGPHTQHALIHFITCIAHVMCVLYFFLF